jgi:superfamily I DNA and/or RNA helicase
MGLGISLFERLTEEGGECQVRTSVSGLLTLTLVPLLIEIPSIMLNVQYRMHPAISYFPSLEFYNLSLLDGTVDRSGYVSPRLMPPNISAALLPPGIQEAGTESNDIRSFVKTSNRPPLIFLDHAGVESQKSNSRINENEAKIIASVVEDLLLNNEVSRNQPPTPTILAAPFY